MIGYDEIFRLSGTTLHKRLLISIIFLVLQHHLVIKVENQVTKLELALYHQAIGDFHYITRKLLIHEKYLLPKFANSDYAYLLIIFYFSGFPNFPVTGSSSSPPSYDSSISSYDAPILDDNSYTAKVSRVYYLLYLVFFSIF